MERMILKNAMSAKYVIGGFALGSWLMQKQYRTYLVHHEMFGIDGNGGGMLKIITDLTDEEMARLKYVRRLYWHWNGSRKMSQGQGREMISDQELSDRGIEWKQEPYVEYTKRPPHDKYLWISITPTCSTLNSI